ncbi:hypothetical protein L0Y65_00285 [Candidatus Micrarchaeota archaeon]|nr:hypothetical protein [Candidatus Micrarchaeota archaeon]
MSDEFEGAIEEAKRLEKKQMEYAPYKGDIAIERTLDLEPREYVDLAYPDMLNMYERSQKIISTANMGILAAGGAGAEGAPEAAGAETRAPKAETGEVETKLLQMTAETLKTAEEVGKEPIAIEKPPEEARPEEPKAVEAVEFESREAPGGIEIEREAPKPEAGPPPPEAAPEATEEKGGAEHAAEAPRPPEAPRTRAAPEPSVEAPAEKRIIVAAVPPALRESPDKAATKRYDQMEEQIRAAVGEKADEMTLKKKMLDLTKQLFKEKVTSRREEIKLQITVLKNMLAGQQAGGAGGARQAPGAKKVGAQAEAHMKLLDAMLSTQQAELAQTKDSIIDSYNKQVAEIKKKFYDQISTTEDASARKKTFESFVFSVESLVEQLPDVLRKYREFTGKKHAAELEKIRDSLAPEEKETRGRVEERLEYVNSKYDLEFTAVKGIVGRQIENLIEVAGTEIFKKPEETPKEAEAKAYDLVKEINETDEGTLLYFLHSKDPDYYKRYERKQLAKAEAIFKAKELMAKDKGLNDAMVKKYFSQMEG